MRLLLACMMVCCIATGYAQKVDVTAFGAEPNSFADATECVQKAIETCRNKSNVIISFPKGRYDFWPDKAIETHYYITNSSDEKEMPVKEQKIGLMLKHLKNITIEGNGSVFMFHGKMVAWVIDSSENITLRNLAVNYERPGMSEMTIKSVSTTTVTATIHPDSKFAIIDGKLVWYGEKWMARSAHLFAALVKPSEGTIFYSNWQPFYNSRAELIAPLTVKFTGDFSRFRADTGDVLTVRDAVRDYVAAFQNRSRNINLQNVHMYSMHGLGIVSQFCKNLNYDSVFIEPEKGSGRVIASSADGMHFSGCKGQITIDHCRFKGLHDDPVNVHGTQLQISEIISPKMLKLRFMHHQTYGFLAFIQGDSIGFVHAQSLQTFGRGIIKSARLVSEREILVELRAPAPLDLKVGDVLDNISWTPSVTIKNSRFEETISRGTLVTTRRKVVIENNVYYRTGMQAILIADDASSWYESGPVRDVTIRNNQFIECGYNSFPDNYIIDIHPEAHLLIPGYYVHKNIVIKNNLFKVYDYPVLFAKSTDGLVFANNTVIRSDFKKPGDRRASVFLSACKQVKISANKFEGWQPEIHLDKMSAGDITSDMSIETEKKSGQ